MPGNAAWHCFPNNFSEKCAFYRGVSGWVWAASLHSAAQVPHGAIGGGWTRINGAGCKQRGFQGETRPQGWLPGQKRMCLLPAELGKKMISQKLEERQSCAAM